MFGAPSSCTCLPGGPLAWRGPLRGVRSLASSLSLSLGRAQAAHLAGARIGLREKVQGADMIAQLCGRLEWGEGARLFARNQSFIVLAQGEKRELVRDTRAAPLS